MTKTTTALMFYNMTPAKSRRCSPTVSAWTRYFVESRTFHFVFDHAHVEFKLVAADMTAATLHVSKVHEKFAEHTRDGRANRHSLCIRDAMLCAAAASDITKPSSFTSNDFVDGSLEASK